MLCDNGDLLSGQEGKEEFLSRISNLGEDSGGGYDD